MNWEEAFTRLILASRSVKSTLFQHFVNIVKTFYVTFDIMKVQ